MKRLVSLSRLVRDWWSAVRAAGKGPARQRAAERKADRALHEERTKRLRALRIVNDLPPRARR